MEESRYGLRVILPLGYNEAIVSEADERLRRALMTLERESMATPAHPWKD